MRYVIIEDGIVVNAVASEGPFNGGWVQSDTANIGDIYDGESFISPLTPQEDIDAAWVKVRSRRDGLLSLCDWTQLPDAPISNTETAEWASYRQALRDITTQSDPFNIEWPVSPGA